MSNILRKKMESWRTTITRILIFASTLIVLVITYSKDLPDDIRNWIRILIIVCLFIAFLSICFGLFALNKLTELEGENVYMEEEFPKGKGLNFGSYGWELVDATESFTKSFNRFQLFRRIQLWTTIIATFLIIFSSIFIQIEQM